MLSRSLAKRAEGGLRGDGAGDRPTVRSSPASSIAVLTGLRSTALITSPMRSPGLCATPSRTTPVSSAPTFTLMTTATPRRDRHGGARCWSSNSVSCVSLIYWHDSQSKENTQFARKAYTDDFEVLVD